ncbi:MULTISPECIES: hypothetical protein [unclassified Leisingera]|uniref:hypothetical protein n=1 Tax=unclassified Leisingera TaxID=2614906 RepID=UPI0002F1FDDA|nr:MULTISPECIES: hypothetical protein [unclassified Leisingera]KIC19620.1 hypothetical protein RA21_03750 [Leisingera sp. ANG-DT]KIC25393.1 hypothetical protein RA23_05875 [Leisingera sp. ANG-S3]KIC54500.1 hypothetical protein RA22_07655 [Leisingera sp. ANG-S]KID10679.1 hypothetical protein GC1_03100 [Leisingera sp. ANG1]
MHHAEFWHVSLREFDLITRARIKAKDAEFAARRVLNQELGILTQFAIHNPGKMPDFTKAIGGKKPAERNRAAELAQLRAGLLNMHFQSKKGQ